MAGLETLFKLPPPKADTGRPQRWPELPSPDLFGASSEWDTLADTLPGFVRKVYREAVALLGEDEAKALFAKTVSKGRGKRGRGKNLAPNRDAFLLREYDRLCWLVRRGAGPIEESRLLRTLARSLHKGCPGQYGATAQAIEWRLRALLRERRKQRSANQRTTLVQLFGEGAEK